MLIPFSSHGWMATAHGVLFGGAYLILLVLALVALEWLRGPELTPEGLELARRQAALTLAAATAAAWVAVVSGTWGIFPFFRSEAAASPTSLLLARPSLAPWAGWVILSKAWVAWASTGLVTLAAAVALARRRRVEEPRLRRRLQGLLAAALVAAAYTATLGTLLAKLAPVG